MDQNFILEKGKHYSDMQNISVIFICTFDPFGFGAYEYTFTNTCRGISKLNLEDRVCTIFYNTEADLSGAPEDIGKLLGYVRSGEISDDLTARIHEQVKINRLNGRLRDEYMKTYTHEIDVWNDGQRNGIEKGLCALAELVKEGVISVEYAAKKLDVDSEVIKARLCFEQE